MKNLALILSFCLLLACKKDQVPVMENRETLATTGVAAVQKTYLALGDSYTIGESVERADTYSYQLAAKLKVAGVNMATPKIFAKTGWTTGELLEAIRIQTINKKYDLVTLLIGVNNQYRGNSKITYRSEFRRLLQLSIGYANGKKDHVFVVSIPDWGVTPFGKKSGKSQSAIAKDIDAFNAINREETILAGVTYVNITPDSRKAATDVSLVASDGLHYSRKMYALWANSLYNPTLQVLK
jgi:lysophospholipase L1-like esterase